ncbi:MAG: hypothetical protein AAGC65_01590 [Mucilaginibacter sp.]|uniref:hypothetical protein n=1 Tax=Mucilaginibacter sp. TaxID=1882438 RepID=UPI0031A5DAA2
MEIEQQIEDLIEHLRRLMPSTGAWPFTVMQLKSSDFENVDINYKLKAKQQLIFLLRTDFDRKDLIDYIANTAEFDDMPAYRREEFLNDYVQRAEEPSALIKWSERIISLGIGFAFILSGDLNLWLEDTAVDLVALDNYLSFPERGLKAYQLFDVYQRDED